MSYRIKPIGINEIDLLTQLVYMTDEFADRSSIYRKMGFNCQKFLDYLRMMLANEYKIIAAMEGGTCLGYALYEVEDTFIDKFNFEILTIYTDPKWVGYGVDRDLICEMMHEALTGKCSYAQVSICAYFDEDRDRINKVTANAFKKFGWEEIGIVMGCDLDKLRGIRYGVKT